MKNLLSSCILLMLGGTHFLIQHSNHKQNLNLQNAKANKRQKMKHGFSLIELIVCIVIFGIVLMTIPDIIFQANNANKTAILQQAVMDTKTIMGAMAGMPWGCVKNENFHNFQNVPIFAKNLQNFYDKNGIEISMQRREFMPIDTDESCGEADILRSIDELKKRNFILKNIISNQSQIISHIDIQISNKAPNGEKNEHIKEIKITSKIRNNDSGQSITMRGYAVNIGQEPKIFVKTLQ